MPRHAREVRQQGRPQSRIDAFRRQVVGERPPARRHLPRTREEIRGQHSRREAALAPHDLVEQFLHPFHSRKQRRPRRALHHEPAQLANQRPVLVVEKEIPHEDLRPPAGFGVGFLAARSLPHAHVADEPVRQPFRQPQPLPAERQIGDVVFGAARIARRSHHLKTAVEQERVHVETVRAENLGETHLTQRLARPRPDGSQRAERRAELDTHGRLGAVIRRHVLGRQAGLQAFQVHLPGSRPRTRARGRAALRVQRPILPGLSLAEYPDEARGFLPRSLEQNLHFPAPACAAAVIRTLLTEDQRVVKLHVLDDHRAASLGGGCGNRHGSIERARGDDPAEHPVIVHPGGVRRKRFGLESDLAAGGLMPLAQQGVPCALPPPLRRLDPEAFTLERIARQRDSPPLFAGEQPLEGKVDPRFVRPRYRVHEPRRRLLLILRRPVQARERERRRNLGREGVRTLIRPRPGEGQHRAQHRVRTDFHHQVDAQVRQ